MKFVFQRERKIMLTIWYVTVKITVTTCEFVVFVVGNEQFYVFEIVFYHAVSLTFKKYLNKKIINCLKGLTKYNLPNIVCLC